METSPIKLIKTSLKHWYFLLIAGLIYIAVGVWVFLALTILFSISFLVSGISEIAFAISNRNELDGWGWNLAFGIMGSLAGLLLLSHPLISIETLPLFVGFVALFRSILAISFSMELKKYGVKNWGSLLFIGILGVIFSYILIWNPLFAGLTLVYWTGLALVTLGTYSVYFSVQLNKLRKMVSSN